METSFVLEESEKLKMLLKRDSYERKYYKENTNHNKMFDKQHHLIPKEDNRNNEDYIV